MRHAVSGRKLNRSSAHRVALRRNLVQSLIEHGKVHTTLPKAKEVRRFAERLVTLAIDGSLAARQRAIAMLNDRAIIAKDHQGEYDQMSDAKRRQVLRARSGRRHRSSTTKPGVKFTAESVIHKLFADIGPRMRKRKESRGAGGYTRIIKLADRRLGDGTPTAILQLVGEEDKPRPKGSDKTERKRRARVKYAVYAGKPIPRRGPRRSVKTEAPKAEEPEAKAAEDQAAEPEKPEGAE
ncbi:MAG: 50S ribosomal protein L17 [Phycisphaerae bacterium]